MTTHPYTNLTRAATNTLLLLLALLLALPTPATAHGGADAEQVIVMHQVWRNIDDNRTHINITSYVAQDGHFPRPGLSEPNVNGRIINANGGMRALLFNLNNSGVIRDGAQDPVGWYHNYTISSVGITTYELRAVTISVRYTYTVSLITHTHSGYTHITPYELQTGTGFATIKGSNVDVTNTEPPPNTTQETGTMFTNLMQATVILGIISAIGVYIAHRSPVTQLTFSLFSGGGSVYLALADVTEGTEILRTLLVILLAGWSLLLGAIGVQKAKVI